MTTHEKVEQCLLRMIEKEQLMAGASVLVSRKGEEVLYVQGGYANREKGLAMRRDNIFRLYSQTKPVTAVAAVMLMERGMIDLMDPVERYLPGFHNQKVAENGGYAPVKRPLVLMDLLGMSAGLSYGGDDVPGQAVSGLMNEVFRRLDSADPMSTIEFANRVGELPLAFHPGERMRYSLCADILGAVVEAADGRPYSRFLKEELFDPLGMKDTAFYISQEKLDRLCTCYERIDGQLYPVSPQNAGVRDFCSEPAYAAGGAGLYSTIDDYMAFATMLLHKGKWKDQWILSPQSVAFLTSPQLPYEEKYRPWHGYEGYSYGKLMRQGVLPGEAPMFIRKGEYGWDGWLGVYFSNFPAEEMTILMMMQIKDTGTSCMQRRLRNVILALESQGLI